MERNNIISEWLNEYGDPEIDKFVENQLNQNRMKQTAVEWYSIEVHKISIDLKLDRITPDCAMNKYLTKPKR